MQKCTKFARLYFTNFYFIFYWIFTNLRMLFSAVLIAFPCIDQNVVFDAKGLLVHPLKFLQSTTKTLPL